MPVDIHQSHPHVGLDARQRTCNVTLSLGLGRHQIEQGNIDTGPPAQRVIIIYGNILVGKHPDGGKPLGDINRHILTLLSVQR